MIFDCPGPLLPRGLSPVVVSGLLIAAASLAPGLMGTWASVVVTPRLRNFGSQAPEHRLSSCGPWA